MMPILPRYPSMEDSGKEWLSEVPEHRWPFLDQVVLCNAH